MAATSLGDGLDLDNEVEAVLRVEVYRAFVAARGITSVTAMAALHGISRQHMHRLLNGERTASLSLAMHIARQFNTTVEALFELKKARAA